MKNVLINRAVSLLKARKPNLGIDQRKFLIVSTTGLGDTLWGTPAIKALRETYPTSYIGVLTSPIGKEILQHNRHVDELFVISDPVFFSLFPLYSRLKKKGITDVVLFHTSQRPILPFVATLGASKIIGTEGLHKGLDHFLTDAVPSAHVHEIERRLQLVAKIGAHTQDPAMEISLSAEDEKLAELYLSQFQLPSYLPKVALHPGAKDLFKQWPPSLFVELGNRLVQELGCQVFVTGTGGEKELVETISSLIKGAIPVTSLKLRPFAAFLKQMKLVVSNDTGPMHVAFAMQTPTVALFAPTDPKLCGPHGINNAIVISKGRTCTPCLKKRCAEPFCLLQISMQEVFEAALSCFYVKDSSNIN
ncbi:MAG: glycosyltransferase family 9 protein [Verrucomicrobia bacterium]|nr:glycosyltransferase family 9 protein [Verrucomicrobiota bacterium]